MVKSERNRLLFIILVFHCLFLSNPVIGQNDEIKNYIHNSLPIENQNWNISQDPTNGIVYFANSNGLIEYNGISKKTYQLPYRKSVRSVLVDDNGIIFTGSFEEFGFWMHASNGQLNYTSLSNDLHLIPNDEIWKIYNYYGKIYFQSFTTIYVYDYKKVTSIKAPYTMLFLFRVGGQFIAQLFSDGLYWFNGEEFKHIKGSEMFKDIKVHAILKRSNDQLYICTENKGIYIYEDKKFTLLKSDISSLLENYTCNAAISIRDTIFAFGTILNGVYITDHNGKIINHYNYLNGLNNNTVLSLYKDNQDGLWIGLDNGANYINIFSSYTYYLNSTGTLGSIYVIYPDNGKLYLGTNHGLFVSDITHVHNVYTFSNTHLVPQSNGQVWTLEKYDGQLLCGHNEGTFRVLGNTFTKISKYTGGCDIKEFNGYLIESTYTGLIIFKKNQNGQWVFRNLVKGFYEPSRNIEVDYLGYIWTNHLRKGIYKLELNDNLDSVIKKDYYDISSEKYNNSGVFLINNKVVFTFSDNIYMYDYENKKIEPFTKLNNQLGEYNTATKIVSYKKNQYWFVKENKIALFEVTKEFTVIKKMEILQKQNQISDRDEQIASLDDKNLIISDPQLFYTYNVSFDKQSVVKQKIQITKIQFQGKNKRIDINPDFYTNIESDFANNNIRVYFSYPNLYEKQDKSFFYIIPEIDNEWRETQLDNISYLNLESGTYHLKIHPEGSSTLTEISFTINTPLYKRWYAFLVYLIIVIGIALLIIRFLKSELIRHKQKIAYELKENKLKNELDFTSNELVLTMRYLIQKNEILAELKDQIIQITDSSTKYPIKSVKYMEKIINEGLEVQTVEWQHAIDNLKLAEQGYFKLLKQKFPNLTSNDLKLCSYLRMNFTTKEIAKLLQISTRAVEISRYRLRKKMQLGHEINLTEYLSFIDLEKGSL